MPPRREGSAFEKPLSSGNFAVIPHLEWLRGQGAGVAASLETQLGRFLRAQRRGMTFAQFSKKVGFPPSTLHRLEQGAQSITLRGLRQIMRKLRCGLAEIFPDEFV